MTMHTTRWQVGAALLSASALLAACQSATYRAPVEDRPRVAGTVPAQPQPQPADNKPLAGSENAGKPGFVTVKPGDTLIRISIDAGQNWRDIARWNNIDNPDSLQVGQVIRVVAPTPTPTTEAGVASRPVTAPRIETRPLDNKPTTTTAATVPAAAASAAGTLPPSTTVTAPPASTPATPSANGGSTAAPSPSVATTVSKAPAATTTAAPAAASSETIAWSWPAVGTIGSTFEEPRNKGIAILGKAGDPITASAFGRVIYGGALRGYGTIVLIKHNESYMSVYGNLRTVLVREGQVVTKGQRIAEMGNSEAERVQVHFEIRRDGEAIDPMKLLPPR